MLSSSMDAIQTAKDLAVREGILTGTSGGGVLSAAIKLVEDNDFPDGTSILAILADTGERYLSTQLFEDIPIDMTEDWRRQPLPVLLHHLDCQKYFRLPPNGFRTKLTVTR